MSRYFPTPYEPFRRDINVKVDLSNYATKKDIKDISHIDISSFALKSNLASLKTEIEKLDIDKLVPAPVDSSKLSDMVKNDVIKKTVYDKLVARVNNIDTSGFVLKTKYDTDKKELENKITIMRFFHDEFVLKANYVIDKFKLKKKIPDASKLVKKTDYNAKITEINGKIPSISGLATTSALIAVENKIPNIISLGKKNRLWQKITEIEKKLTDHDHDKYGTTPEFNNLAAEVFDARLKQADLVTWTNFDTKLKSLNQKINSNKTKHLLVENELK